MNKSFLQRNWPHAVAVIVFLLVAVFYCKPIFDGMVVSQHDTQGWQGMAQQSIEFKEKYGHYPYWTNSQFSGMPGYQVAFETPNKISIGVLHNYIFTLGLPKPVNFFFLASIMAYFLLSVLRVNPWIAMLGALSYAYATYDPIIVAVGHDTKMICIGYAPAVIASLLVLFNGRHILGTVLTALFASMIIWQNHIQITYYTLIVALCIGVAFVIHSIRSGQLKQAVIAGALALVAGGIAVGTNMVNIWPMNEYAKETMRGGRSELTDTAKIATKTAGGLDKDYAFYYGSYGINETFTFIVPNLYGGGSYGTPLKEGGSAFASKMAEAGVPEENALQYANAYAYWGNQPGHAGPVYLGAIICFLVIAGFFFLNGWLKWGLLAASAFAIILSWGKNLEGINYFLFDHLPLYKKFRAPSMSLVVPQLAFVTLAAISLQQILFGTINKEDAWKKFKLSLYVTGAVLLLLTAFYFSFDYRGPNDAALKDNFTNGMLQQLQQGQQPTSAMQQQAEDFGRGLIKGLQQDRQSLYGKDLLRSIFFILAAAALIGLYIKNKIKPVVAMAIIVLLGVIDLLAVGKRYLGADKFVEPAQFESAFQTNAAVQQIKADPTKHFRVFDQADGDPFSSSVASYHFNAIGGYSPAKLALYQDIIERQLSKGNMNVFNMLNTRYFIMQNSANGQPMAQLNPAALGNAWFVKALVPAKNADEEMSVLDKLNTKDSAVFDIRFNEVVSKPFQYDSAATITLTENLNDIVRYESKAATPQFAVFSEVYYPHGWDAYIDGQKVAHARVNYVLRGMPIPAGTHKIEFRFEPRSVILSDKITMWFNILIYLLLAAGIFMEFRKKKTA